MPEAIIWLIFSSSLIGFGYFLISKILESKNNQDEDDTKDDTENQS